MSIPDQAYTFGASFLHMSGGVPILIIKTGYAQEVRTPDINFDLT
jgi:hypothetical protein